MLAAIRRKLGALWTDLSQVGERQPLNRAALVIVLFLDLFILVSIFEGLDAHTAQLTTPAERIPVTCAEIVIDRRWSETSRLDRLADAAAVREVPAERRHEPSRSVHPSCAPLLDAIDAARTDEEVSRALRAHRRVEAEIRELGAALSTMRPAYDTALLEAIAAAPHRQGIAAIEKDVREKTAAVEKARAQLATIDAALEGNPRVAAVWARIAALTEDDARRLESDRRRITFWFPLKRLGMQLLFLVPLFAAFYAWSVRSARGGRGVQTLVSSHLLVVSFVPIFGKLAEAVHDVIPKRLLAKLIALLAALNLVAIWYDLVIAAAIAAALFLIWVVQRKLFSREKLVEKRIGKGLCQDCGKRLPAHARACPFCGFSQFVACPACRGPAHVHASHCAECGTSLRAAGSTAPEPG
jgi:hypothetical protein